MKMHACVYATLMLISTVTMVGMRNIAFHLSAVHRSVRVCQSWMCIAGEPTAKSVYSVGA